MLSRLFRAHGRMCASHPWEVIILSLTVTLCLVSMSAFSSPASDRVCGWNYLCHNQEEIKSSDIIILAITRCLAVAYIYLQFRNLRRLGSKYLLGIAGVFTIFSSFVFSISLINLVGSDLRGLNEALPFFLLLVDLGKASALARFSLSATSQTEVRANIATGMSVIGPAITLDAIVETLVIGVGTLSGVRQLETMCCFGCLSVIANYLAFLTFYPACLAIILEVSRERNQGKPLKQLQQLAKILQAEEEEKTPNPVTQRVKIIMSAGLVLVHAHSRLVAENARERGVGEETPHALLATGQLTDRYIQPQLPLWRFYLDRMLTVNMDYTITLVLATALILKYVLFDNDQDQHVHALLEKETGLTPTGSGTGSPQTSGHTSSDQMSAVTDSPQTSAHTRADANSDQMSAITDSPQSQPQTSATTNSPLPQTSAVTNSPQTSAIINSPQPETSAVTDISQPQISAGTSPLQSARLTEGEIRQQEQSRADAGVTAASENKRESRHNSGTGPVSDVLCEKRSSQGTTVTKDRSPRRAVSFMVGDDSSDKEEKDTADRLTQTEFSCLRKENHEKQSQEAEPEPEPRDLQTCVQILKSEEGVKSLTDREIISLVRTKNIPFYKIEKVLGQYEKGVDIRRRSIQEDMASSSALSDLPYTNYDYKYVDGACCENVIGYMPVPVGVAGPLILDGKAYMVPMATTEGCLVASVNRGCAALRQSGGVMTYVYRDAMSRAPVVEFPSIKQTVELMEWLEDGDNFELVKDWFDSTSRFARLKKLTLSLCDRQLYIRFVASTGDAMGMNMISKGCEAALKELNLLFPDMVILSLSGNFCTDKKSSAINWLEGRGKSVACCATVPGAVVRSVLKTTAADLVKLNLDKNVQGSAMAGVLGGFNAHAANMVAAVFIATGQDAAQVVASSNCLTKMEVRGAAGEDLYISCTMPSLELGTVGGGTVLPPQAACLKMLGVCGSSTECPGANARRLASIVCATVLAGELNLMAILNSGQLVSSHLRHNRSTINLSPSSGPSLHHSKTAPGTCLNNAS